jgi:hypothetical protein
MEALNIRESDFHNWVEFVAYPAVSRLPSSIRLFYRIFFAPELVIFGAIFGI